MKIKIVYVGGKKVKLDTPLENCVIGDVNGKPVCYDEYACIDCYYPLKDWDTNRWVDSMGCFVCKDCFDSYEKGDE